MTSINSLSNYNLAAIQQNEPVAQPVPQPEKPQNVAFGSKDEVTLSSKAAPVEVPKLGFFRLAFSRIPQEKIDIINKNKLLPENAKFIPRVYGQGYAIANNIMGISLGTRILPEGFELKNNSFGFTMVVPKGSTALFLK